ncbi:hypothetical protein [Acinetobacter sp.]|uniref:hypothetical protein n=2 Tax=Acinetobacter TaxID=469 RepID=UPI00289B1F17|nr:hypothetical protein [Acinetobacter sp.]
MENRWHADQENNMRPDVKGLPCPFCGYDHGIAVDSNSHDLKEHGVIWSARAFCHECGAQSPSTNITTWPDHPLSEERIYIDWENEREVVNLAVKIWNIRKYDLTLTRMSAMRVN